MFFFYHPNDPFDTAGQQYMYYYHRMFIQNADAKYIHFRTALMANRIPDTRSMPDRWCLCFYTVQFFFSLSSQSS